MTKFTTGAASTTAIIVAGFGVVGTVTVSIIGAWATASSTANTAMTEMDTKVHVVEEREKNHYTEVKEQLDRIETKIDRIK